MERKYNAANIFKRAQGAGPHPARRGARAPDGTFGEHIVHVDLVGSAPRRNWKQTLVSDGYVVVRHPDLGETSRWPTGSARNCRSMPASSVLSVEIDRCEAVPTDRTGLVVPSVAGGAVDRLAQQVGVAVVAGVLLEHVGHDPAQGVGVPLSASSALSSNEWPATIPPRWSRPRHTWRNRATSGWRSPASGGNRRGHRPGSLSSVQ